MNEYLISVILGVVEGLTEFIPVSSTAHLRIVEALLGIDLGSGYWKMYSIVIQLGAILCLPIFYRRKLMAMFRSFPRGDRGDRTALTHPLTLTLIAFVVTAVPTFFLTRLVGKNLESLLVIGLSLLVGGVVMWVVDVFFAGGATAAVSRMSVPQAVWVGACQILSAVFPGTSRSMSTIAAGQLGGMNRPTALEFSFFLSIPTMAAATGYDFLKTVVLHKGEGHTTLPPVHMSAQGWVVLAIGFVTSFIVALAVVAWFTAWVRRRGFVPFAVYRILLGAGVLGWTWHTMP